MLVLDALYLLLLLLSWPFWLTYVLKRSYRSLLRGRLRPQLEPSDTGSIWIHAVSVGEVRSLRSLVDALGQSGRRVVLSVTTPAGFASARREFPSLPVIHSPFDLSFVVRRFIGRINPRLVIFNELEVWPNWIWLLHRRRIPMLLINGRVSLAAFRRYRLFQCILRPFFLRIDAFLVQSQIYRQRFLRLRIPPERIHVCGNIKADEAERGAQELPPPGEVRAHLRLPAPERKIVVLASSHASDEAVFIPAIASRSRDFLFIIVPRHVQRAPGIAARLQRGGIAAALFSRLPEGEGAGPPFQVLIYDLVGYLFAIMSIAEIVFMGGTCDARLGGHNLYEPAALGKVIVGGPHYENFPEIGRELEANGAYRRVADAREWQAYLQFFSGVDRQRIGASARRAVAEKRGSLACSLERIQRYLA